MKIVQLTPGAGDNFYCENCLRDVALVRAMGKLGLDVVMVPMYLPIQGDIESQADYGPIFFGGINVYLQQKSALFRKTPRWIDRLFDCRGPLKWAGRKADMTSARVLSETTISMLRGEQGRQVKELDRLVVWLSQPTNKPDVVCLSNVLLIGLAKRIKEKIGAAVVCLLQDEDAFLDGLESPYRERAWRELAERSKDVDVFIAVSKYYAEVMRQRLGLEPEKLKVVNMGISLDGFESQRPDPKAPVVGYLSRMCADKGLDILVDAFIILKKNEKLKDLRLRIAGGKSGKDEVFIKGIQRKLKDCGLDGDVEFLPSFERDAKLEFLKSLSILSVPEKKPIAYGLYVLEALAMGVPVVEPAAGVFVELLEETGGGILYEPNDSRALAESMEKLLLDTDYAQGLAKSGREAIFEKFSVERTAQQMMSIFEQVLK